MAQRKGGERRLNVLISRAKLRCEIFCNFTGADIDLERTKARGVAALKLFLTFAETGHFGMGEVSGEDFDSEFEIQVCERLQALGYDVKRQIGASGFRVDLAISDPEKPGRFLLGIECDGAQYHSSRSARDPRTLVWPDLVWAHFSRPRFGQFDERVAAAAAAGFAGIGLYLGEYARLRDEEGRSLVDIAAVLDGHGIVLSDVEVVRGWWAVDGPERDECQRLESLAYELADGVGARYVQVIGPYACSTDQAVEGFAALCDRAAAHGLLVGIEWLPYTNIATVKLFSHANREAGYARSAMQDFITTVYGQMRLVTAFEIVNHLLSMGLIASTAWPPTPPRCPYHPPGKGTGKGLAA